MLNLIFFTEQELLVGASHNPFPTRDTAVSTGILLELARSMAYVRDMDGWKPRRTVKFLSFGGGPYRGRNKYFEVFQLISIKVVHPNNSVIIIQCPTFLLQGSACSLNLKLMFEKMKC